MGRQYARAGEQSMIMKIAAVSPSMIMPRGVQGHMRSVAVKAAAWIQRADAPLPPLSPSNKWGAGE
jgi:hypothetical protein